MPYSDPQLQKAAQHRHYLRNKEKIRERTRKRREDPGYYKRAWAKERKRKGIKPRTTKPKPTVQDELTAERDKALRQLSQSESAATSWRDYALYHQDVAMKLRAAIDKLVQETK